MNKCPLCNSSRTATLYTCTDKLVSGKEFPVTECTDCGFIFTSDIPDSSEIGAYYKSEEYISHSDSKEGLFNRIYHIARQRMLRRKSGIVRKYSDISEGKLIDIGCGTGYFAGCMKDLGWDVTGVESDKEAAKVASGKFSITVKKLDELPGFKAEGYDAITLWHVLEHLYEPAKLIQQFSKLLNAYGTLIIALPNNKSYDAKMYREKWAAWDVPRHLWHFNIESFKVLVKDSDLVLIKVKRMPLDAFYVSVLSEKNYSSNFALPKGFIVGLLGWFVSLFNRGSSSSLIYILKKKS